MHRLQEVILERAGALISVMDLSAELDWWVSRLVPYTIEYNMPITLLLLD